MDQVRHSSSSSSSSSSCPSKKSQNPESSSCGEKAVEFACSVCVLSVSCPAAMAWCLIKLPCEFGWHAACYVRKRACCWCSDRRIYAADYSSFSDIEEVEPGRNEKGNVASASCIGRREKKKKKVGYGTACYSK